MPNPSTTKRRKRGGGRGQTPQQQQRQQQRLQQKLLQKQQPPRVTEESRIHIRQTLAQFQASNDEMYKFDASLTNFERAEVHKLCVKMGLKSKSQGPKEPNKRCVTVYKCMEKLKKIKEKSDLTSFTFSEKGKEVLNDYFSVYPPGDQGEGEKIMAMSSKNTDKIRTKTNDILWKPLMKKADIAKKLESLAARMESDIKLKQITEGRSKLPIASFKDVITSTIESHQVVLISGETGCGKTTQVPQYMLDYMWSKGDACKVICTQPRRISAISVAERISFERGENIGESVGYKIRLETKGGKNSSIVFCTTGVLLRVLVKAGNGRSRREATTKMFKDAFPDITHIIVDEIHERDRFTDFLLAILRDMLPSYPHLRVVLMSATLDAERISQYFGGCPIIRVPGFTYNVKRFYLEDVLLLVKSTKACHLDCTSKTSMDENSQLTEDFRLALEEAINLAWSSDEMESLLEFFANSEGLDVLNFQHSVTGITPLMVFARKGRVGDMCMLLSFGANCHLQDNEGKTALSWAAHENQKEAAEILRKHLDSTLVDPREEQLLLDKYLHNVNPELTDVILIEQLLRKICTESEEGAILVFLPGWDDINKARDKLSSSTLFKDSSKFLILALHSMVPSIEQKKVFKRPPQGCRKIILSTNIAETAVTIDDVVFVIDSGRMKEKSYDPYNKVSTLQSSWISKASAKQREGRAGRCQSGICYHLYSKLRAASLPEFQVPEIKRTPIEELCLQVKLLDPDSKIEDFLKKTLDPPVSEAIHNAITILQDIGALSPNEDLTELGEKLGSIPVHPLTSKMLLFAISMDCLDPALTLACANDYRDPFTLPMLPGEKKKATAAKCELASLYGGHGDQFAIIAAFECWKNAKNRGQEGRFCRQYFVSPGVMNMLFGMRKQLENELYSNGFIPGNSSQLSANCQDVGIIHAVLVAGLYPLVGKLHLPKRNVRSIVIENANNNMVRLHPQSVNSRLRFKKKDAIPLVIFDEITRGDGGLNIRSCSIIGPLPLLLLATEIAVAPLDDDSVDDNDTNFEDSDEEEGNDEETGTHSGYKDRLMSSPDNVVKIVADRWLSFESTALDVAQIYCLRERLSAAIMFKITHPGKDLPELLAASIHAIANVLSYDGLAGIIMPLETVDSLTSKVQETDIGQQGKVNGDSDNFLRSLLASNDSQPQFQNQRGWLKHHPSSSAQRNHHHNQNAAAISRGPRGESLKRHRGYRA
ncbi:DExH-box ATP-dependent RNA helicase DExH6 isoform X1 [Cynara cardunculus var. scolymus]|uniref:DExH-box ATP-dependent RNA helicase DExH6 isoform X1 n=3 Tax=Cynara cardunculus var. scolymus TaxID=59895 RepID=UPI000D62F237|nr:DExH-box ATP-dependent RNA helicase DExH6 isoform X1 [Cynara cardunculus var. scolymus]